MSHNKFWIHVFCGDKRIRYLFSNSVPPIGAEIRLSARQFYTVERAVWCFDESALNGQRVNIEVKKVNLRKKRAYGDES